MFSFPYFNPLYLRRTCHPFLFTSNVLFTQQVLSLSCYSYCYLRRKWHPLNFYNSFYLRINYPFLVKLHVTCTESVIPSLLQFLLLPHKASLLPCYNSCYFRTKRHYFLVTIPVNYARSVITSLLQFPLLKSTKLHYFLVTIRENYFLRSAERTSQPFWTGNQETYC